MQKDDFTWLYMKATKRTKTTGSRALPKVGFQRTEGFFKTKLWKKLEHEPRNLVISPP